MTECAMYFHSDIVKQGTYQKSFFVFVFLNLELVLQLRNELFAKSIKKRESTTFLGLKGGKESNAY